MLNLKNELLRNYGLHRSGWSYGVNSLKDLHSDSGPELISFIEKKFIFGNEPGDIKNGFSPVNYPWVGFLHVPVDVPDWFNRHYSPEVLFEREDFKTALSYCKGIYTLSTPLTKWVEGKFSGPVGTLLHPTEFIDQVFNAKSFISKNRIRVVQLGFWLRKLHAIHALKLPDNQFDKVVVGITQPYQKKFQQVERMLFDFDIDPRVKYCGFLSDNEYDEMLLSSVMFIDFYDTSANNAIIECIARGIPIVCPPMQSVVDYLGVNYPLYFHSYSHAKNLLNDRVTIIEAHEYIMSSGVRDRLTGRSFCDSMSGLLSATTVRK